MRSWIVLPCLALVAAACGRYKVVEGTGVAARIF